MSNDKGILIVDDEDNARKVLKEILSAEGYVVYDANSLTQCLSILTGCGDEIYLVLLDMQLPDGYGPSLMEYLVNSNQYIIGVIIVTAYGDVEAAADFFKSGNESVIAADFVQKPWGIELLLDHINRTVNMISEKRKTNKKYSKLQLSDKLEEIISNQNRILENLNTHKTSFLKDLGLDLIRVILIGLAVIAFLYLDMGNAISKILEMAK